ncbi:MAG: DNA-binding protein [Candidatus Handelsmanbacteria bacterium RIFCSPLOWO2_12_FULL_64_10]|uniref:DNA-binding protein n=1 Tax=Handelsmanbacteria sp. (strain RIFCSPLOWO2_12_FULL_64_10) TaxID=1817868 RepID=A0A1F6CBJ3_HANXR|nr:MAG: DNA-binding protein [Candidatus Handelsmanbacteria bacterium RIFCSPLOWO2_12_FULL_64_10]
MASRHEDWLKQGRRDLDHARRALEDGDCEWACFAAQQGAEKAVKAVYQKAGGVAWGHSVTVLLESLPESLQPEQGLLDDAKELDKHYIPPRYPNAHPEGAPYEYYTRGEAERAIASAGRVIGFCAGVLAGPDRDAGATSKGPEGPV